MSPDSLAILCGADPVTTLGVVVRMATVVAVGGLASFPRLGPRIGLAAGLALSAAALPTAVARGSTPQPVVLLLVGEAIVGLGLGLAVAVAFAAASWGGGILGSVSGASWADDFAGDPPTGEGGAARLAGWLAVAGFLATGGHLVLVTGLVDSVHWLPIGGFASAISRDELTEMIAGMPSAALSLALALALPALTAVLTFHVAAALCLRSVRFVVGPGSLQAAASLVLLAAVVAGAAGWTEGFATAVRPLLERGLVEASR
jgi:flagellar biosynthetic protein FliR